MATESADRTLDVREIAGPSFEDIVTALEAFERNQRLIAPFEPVPLYERGFAYESEQREGELWRVRIEYA